MIVEFHGSKYREVHVLNAKCKNCDLQFATDDNGHNPCNEMSCLMQ